MNNIYLIIMAVFLAGVGILLLRYTSLRKKSINWLYLLSGGLALYVVETANPYKPIQNTFLVVVALYLIPIIIDAVLSRRKDADDEHNTGEKGHI